MNVASISTNLTFITANTSRKTTTLANPPKIQYLGVSSTRLDRRFLNTCPDLRSVAGHRAASSTGLALNRPIRSRVSRNSALGTATSATGKTLHGEVKGQPFGVFVPS
jgi:hypothetical protein